MTFMGNGGPPTGPQFGQPAAPQIDVLGQYVKDFSFENPNAPQSLQPTQEQPQLNIHIDIGVNTLQESDYEVTLKLEGKAKSTGSVLFAFDLTFCGIFKVQNIPQEHLQPFLMIECPRLLFPFAREIIATAVRNGGFAPFLLPPVDFVQMYQQRLAEQQPPTPQFTMPT